MEPSTSMHEGSSLKSPSTSMPEGSSLKSPSTSMHRGSSLKSPSTSMHRGSSLKSPSTSMHEGSSLKSPSTSMHRGSSLKSPSTSMHRGSLLKPPSTSMHKGSSLKSPSTSMTQDSSLKPPSTSTHHGSSLKSPLTSMHQGPSLKSPSTPMHKGSLSKPPLTPIHQGSLSKSPSTSMPEGSSLKPPSTPMHQGSSSKPPSTPMHQRSLSKPPSTPIHQGSSSKPPSTPMHQRSSSKPLSTPIHQGSSSKPPSTPMHQGSSSKPPSTPIHQGSSSKPPSTPMHQGSSSKPPLTPMHQGSSSKPPSTPMHQGSSSKSHCEQKKSGLPKLNPKHKIFLSHSGEQKEFVRQLFKDLEAETHQPFFDEQTSSLMMGERFAPLIFEAARQCLVSVIVLSEDFLTSKWPMLELVEFVKAKETHNPHLKLLPLFYKLSPEDLKVESNVNRWKAAWTKIITLVPDQVMPLNDNYRQLDLSLCMKAFRELRRTNGHKFANFSSEVAYREAIVKEISLLVDPDLLDDTSDVIGNERLCKVISGMFVEDTVKDSNTYKLGLYGMHGLGKTTMSRALCMFFHKCFNGRVFHVELGSRPPLDLQKLVLFKLLQMNKDLVEKVHTIHEGRKLLKDHMKRQRVFLVIDNITDDRESKSQALAFLEAGFHRGSMIMITSCSLDVVEELFPNHPNAIYCKAIPKLSEEEARLMFLRRAAPQRQLDTLAIEEKKILRKCLSQCHFLLDTKETHYHPFAVQAVASFCHKHDNLDILKWNGHLGDHDKLRLSNASSSLFVVLGLQFTTLALKEMRTFLDLCLYIDQDLLVNGYSKVLSWLVDVHEDTPPTVESQLRSLKRSGIINVNLNKDGDRIITIHDLYREFAKWYMIHGEGSHCQEFRCVYHTNSTNLLPYVLRKTSSSSSQLQRIRLENLTCSNFPLMKVQEWCNVVVLQIHKCSNLKVLDLHGLSCLCHLELVKLHTLESFHFAKLEVDNNIGSNATLESLQHVVLIGLRSLNGLPNFSLCTLLKTFQMLECERLLSKPPRFMGCLQLKDLNLEWNRHWRVEKFKLDTLTSLTSLKVYNQALVGTSKLSTISPLKVVDSLTLTGLGKCAQLEILILVALPITNLKGLEKLTKLQELHINLCDSLQYIPDVSTLVQLRSLLVVGGLFEQFLGVEGLLRLRRLKLLDNLKLKSLPNLDHLQELTYVHLRGCNLLKVQPRLPLGCWLVSGNT